MAMSDWKLERFKWATQALAVHADVQLRLFPDLVCKADELALEWDQHFRAVATDSWTVPQVTLARSVDAKLEAMSHGGQDYQDTLWDDSALRCSSHWAELRLLAAAVLDAFGWPCSPPPGDSTDRGSTYVR